MGNSDSGFINDTRKFKKSYFGAINNSLNSKNS